MKLKKSPKIAPLAYMAGGSGAVTLTDKRIGYIMVYLGMVAPRII
jgi:hypothetical protein